MMDKHLKMDEMVSYIDVLNVAFNLGLHTVCQMTRSEVSSLLFNAVPGVHYFQISYRSLIDLYVDNSCISFLSGRNKNL